jgi:hypothetical protein
MVSSKKIESEDVIVLNADTEKAQEEEVSYETDPTKCPENMVINLGDAPYLLPSGKNNNTTVRMLKGDRLRGKNFVDLVIVHKIPRLQLCCKCSAKTLIEMEEVRQERHGIKPEQWIKEAWALKKSGEEIVKKKK